MFEGLNLKKDLVEYESQRLKERVRELNEDQRRQYFNLLGPALKAVSYTHLTLPTNREV